ncbi:hypothetical protein CTA2_4989 [Colletotrichum tanaceti]|uniref:Uncharacterized protein n=1 Tax=Colletotrichum tanaceti TaxID=1306861 RepID=A0A4U6XS67_9PEZI|nr:hypothetical protein CTA2_4970 [Colletotrichum tanaceti]KAJ0168546.1 hypothetical protein CTA2_4989 [Colletotrichum tanaceti]TKW58730.1 hypothetical protein CTA1_3194 [Colletotrichum tanaceti]
MGVSLSTAKWLAPLSFAVDFAAQNYGMLSSPNMKDVHDANLSFWSPQPFFIAGFFFPQQLFQLAWLWRLYKADASVEPMDADIGTMVDFAPFYAVGNLCIATWMIFWNSSNLKTANVFVAINSLTQLYFIFKRLPPMNTKSINSVLTHVVAKTFAGIGVLDLLHNTSVAYFVHQHPSTTLKVLTGVGFGLLASASDWIFGGCLVYDLVALSVGQSAYGNADWSRLLGIFAGGAAAIVSARNLLKPPYISQPVAGYQPL